MNTLNLIFALAEHVTIKEHMHGDVSYLGQQDLGLLSNVAGWACVALAVFIAVVVLLWLIFKTKNNWKILRICFILVWVLGFVVYDVGMCTGEYVSLLTNAPMAILYAFKIFLLDSDVSEIHEPFHSNWVYSFFFALVHCLAAIISTLFVIKYIGFNLLAKLRMYWESRSWFEKHNVDVTYVFWNPNEATYNLIKSIKDQHSTSSKTSTHDTSYRIIVLRTDKEKNDALKAQTGLMRLFNMLSTSTKDFLRLKDFKCLTAETYRCLTDESCDKETDDVLGRLFNNQSLKQLLKDRTRKKIHMLFLSDDEKENLHGVNLLLKDTTIQNFAKISNKPDSEETDEKSKDKTDPRLIFYCHARKNSVHRVIEDKNSSDNVKVEIVDTSNISVEQLKTEEFRQLLPVNFVSVEKDATVSSDFRALVVGFSEVGQDSVRFLYEYAAFVKTACEGNKQRSSFHIDVVDKQMADLAGTFVANAPAIKPSLPFINGENASALISLHNMDCRSVNFYLQLEELLKNNLNYVVIATNDDDINISLAIRIFKTAIRYRKNMDNFCILVRIHNDEDGHIEQITQYYNELWKVEVNAIDDKNFRNIIHVFGQDKRVYTYDIIIDNSLEKNAQKYKDRYEKSCAKSDVIEHNTESKKVVTEDQKDKEKEKKKHTKYSEVLKNRRTQGQDFANCYHEFTKKILVLKALSKLGKIDSYSEDNIDEIFIKAKECFVSLSRKDKTIDYEMIDKSSIDEDIKNILRNLAITEHLRWNASHEILGYVLGEKNEAKMTHDCLKNWEDLKEDQTRSYDCNVSDFILGVKIER